MKSIISFVFLLLAITNVDLATAQFPSDPVFRCRNTGNYTRLSAFDYNLRAAINKVGGAEKFSGNFYNASYGTAKDAVYALALCTGVGIRWGANCNKCATNLHLSLIDKCPNQKDAVMWGSNCMFRYSDRKIFGVLDDWAWIFDPEREYSNKEGFDKSIYELATRLQREASQGSDVRKAALGTIRYPPHSITVYGAMQCTPDLSTELCSKCLQSIILSHHPCCSGKAAARMFSPNCYFIYSHQEFSKWHEGLATPRTGYITI